VAEATARTRRWLERSIAAHRACALPGKGVLFGIAQGGSDLAMRREEAEFIAGSDVSGSAIGGLSVGEPKSVMAEVLEIVCPELPAARPRYLMGVGSPDDLWNSVARGVDMFDCVLPTRLARHGALFTPDGRIDVLKGAYKHQHAPLDDQCDAACCTRFTAAYLHHLLRAGEVLGLRLATLHNVRFLIRQMTAMREAIKDGTFARAQQAFLDRYRISAGRAGTVHGVA
jgi:queuine tRNA-ribosyltransferase